MIWLRIFKIVLNVPKGFRVNTVRVVIYASFVLNFIIYPQKNLLIVFFFAIYKTRIIE